MDDGALEELANNSMPCVGMKFDSEEAAYEFYNEYGRIVGYSIRRDYHTKRKKDGIMINRKRDLSKWILMKFDDNHNHLLHIPQCTHMMPSQRKLCHAQGINVDVDDDTGISLKLDADEMITNIFWTDHQMITDYDIFGDVVSFNTTFRTNKEYHSLALFTGFNHFRMTVIFGAALLYDETTASFQWLFETFLHAM
ncbi:hypothetical protein ACSBR2_042824 [Camellia fascicularis]